MNLNYVTKDVKLTFYQKSTKITIELFDSEIIQLLADAHICLEIFVASAGTI
jgi:hypothetical protein